MNTYLAIELGAWLPDLILCAVLLLGTLIGALRGFVKGVMKIAGVILAGIVAVTFCNVLQNQMEAWFGLTTKLTEAIGGHATIAYWLATAICFVALALVTWLVCFLLGIAGKSLISKVKFLRGVDRVLGGILGFVQTALILTVVLAIFYWVSKTIPSVGEFINLSTITSKIFNWEWFQNAAHLQFTQG